jgi:L-lactate dehydrogenase (cytochrome)
LFSQSLLAHNIPFRSCWVIINSKVYDVTDFLPVSAAITLFIHSCPYSSSYAQEHPGGAQIILKYAGKDATAVYEPIHPSDALVKHLSPSQHLGELDVDAARALQKNRDARGMTKDEERVQKAEKEKPPLNRILSLKDMEVGMFIYFDGKY